MSHYAKMGFKGFKIDFINRDDQQAVKFCEGWRGSPPRTIC